MEAIMRGMSILSCPNFCFLNLHNVRALLLFSDSFVRQFQPNTPKPHFPFQSDGICQNHLSPVLFVILATSACYTTGKHVWNLNSLPLACDLVHLNVASITSAIWGKNTDGACLVGPVGASKQIDTETLQMDPHFECNWSRGHQGSLQCNNFLQQILMIHPWIKVLHTCRLGTISPSLPAFRVRLAAAKPSKDLAQPLMTVYDNFMSKKIKDSRIKLVSVILDE